MPGVLVVAAFVTAGLGGLECNVEVKLYPFLLLSFAFGRRFCLYVGRHAL